MIFFKALSRAISYRGKECLAPFLALGDISRYVSYYEQEGDLGAGELYRKLAKEQRRGAGANLDAASKACLCNLDFASVLDKAERYFG